MSQLTRTIAMNCRAYAFLFTSCSTHVHYWSYISLPRDNGSETVYSILLKPRANRLFFTTL